jgi:hypothetical protein
MCAYLVAPQGIHHSCTLIHRGGRALCSCDGQSVVGRPGLHSSTDQTGSLSRSAGSLGAPAGIVGVGTTGATSAPSAVGVSTGPRGTAPGAIGTSAGTTGSLSTGSLSTGAISTGSTGTTGPTGVTGSIGGSTGGTSPGAGPQSSVSHGNNGLGNGAEADDVGGANPAFGDPSNPGRGS